MPASEETVEDTEAEDQGYRSDDEKEDLGPNWGVAGPGSEVVSWREVFCGIEDGKRRRDEGQDDQAAAKVDTTEQHLSDAYSDLDFLF